MAQTRRGFDPSDRAAAERQVGAKFSPEDADRLFAAARRFMLIENRPWGKRINEKAVEQFDAALANLIATITRLPPDLLACPPPEPAINRLPPRLRDAMVSASHEVFDSESTEKDDAGMRRRAAATRRFEEATRDLGLIAPERFADILSTWRAAFRIEGNQPDPKNLDSILAARNVRVRFAAAVTWRTRRDEHPVARVSGRDLALLAIWSGLESHPADVDFDLVVDRWKKALVRSEEILDETRTRELRTRAADHMQRLRLMMAHAEYGPEALKAYKEWRATKALMQELEQKEAAPRRRRRAARLLR